MRRHNTGMALIISLLLLLVSTILATAAVSGAVLGERIAGNHRQGSDAFMAAEAGVAATLKWFQADPERYSDNGGHWIVATDDVSAAAAKASAMARAVATGGSTVRAGASWHIEDIARSGAHAVRFTSVGQVAGTGATRRIAAVFDRPRTLSPEAPAAEAAYTCFGRDCLVSIGGNAILDGRDWAPPADFDCQGGSCSGTQLDPLTHTAVTGVYLPDDGRIMTGGGGSGGGSGKGKDADAKHVDGDPATRITAAYDGASDVAYWRDYVQTLGAADAVAGTVSTGSIGTRQEPRVSEVTSAAHIAGKVGGAGVLVVREGASLKITGTFHFEGLIIVEAGAVIEMGRGTVDVFGAIVVLGGHPTEVDGDFSGSLAIRYSSAALANLTNIETGSHPGGLSAWHEL